jgi:hypothetical protein
MIAQAALVFPAVLLYHENTNFTLFPQPLCEEDESLRRKERTGRETVTIVTVTEPEQLIMVRELFEAYAASLDFDLTFQDFQAELASLPENMPNRTA